MVNMLNGLLNYSMDQERQKAASDGGLLGVQRVSDTPSSDDIMSDVYEMYLKNKFSDQSPMALAYTQQARDLSSEILRRAQSGDPAATSVMEFYKRIKPGGDPRWDMMFDMRAFLTENDIEKIAGSRLSSPDAIGAAFGAPAGTVKTAEDAANLVRGLGMFDMYGRPRPPIESLFQGQNIMRLPISPMRQYLMRE